MASSATGLSVHVDDNGTGRALELLGHAGLIKAERVGITKHVKMVRGVAQSMADFNQGSIAYRTRVEGLGGAGYATGKVGIKDYKLRFYAAGVAASGTVERKTRSGWNRGVEIGDPFMARAASLTDPMFQETLDDAINESIRLSGLG